MQGGQGDTALIVACYNGHSGIARALLDQGAMINYTNQVRLIIIIIIYTQYYAHCSMMNIVPIRKGDLLCSMHVTIIKQRL